MSERLSPRLRGVVDALPLFSGARVLEIGCGTGAAARAVCSRIRPGLVLGVDRSPRAIALASRASAAEIADGSLRLRQAAIENFVLESGEELFDIAFAVRVGALDGRNPTAAAASVRAIAAALTPTGRLFVDTGTPLREIVLPR